jgi:predicted metal-binding protein
MNNEIKNLKNINMLAQNRRMKYDDMAKIMFMSCTNFDDSPKYRYINHEFLEKNLNQAIAKKKNTTTS